MALDIQVYERDESTEERAISYMYLMERLRASVEHDRERRRRQEQVNTLAKAGNQLAARERAKQKAKAKAKGIAAPAATDEWLEKLIERSKAHGYVSIH